MQGLFLYRWYAGLLEGVLHGPAVLQVAYPLPGPPVLLQDTLKTLAFPVALEYGLELTPIVQKTHDQVVEPYHRSRFVCEKLRHTCLSRCIARVRV